MPSALNRPRPLSRKKATLETYQAKANAALDQAIGWNKLKPDMVKLYTSNFSESELKDLVAFYQSPLGKKVLEKCRS